MTADKSMWNDNIIRTIGKYNKAFYCGLAIYIFVVAFPLFSLEDLFLVQNKNLNFMWLYVGMYVGYICVSIEDLMVLLHLK